jgi:glycosyltransferase involved in cell wall biosynthesis
MLVSVVIPVFNADKWIEATLASVRGQTYKKMEIILVDDGSTDNSIAVAEAALGKSDTAFRILHQENRGAACARNVGWRAARGAWIQFLDADDLLAPEKIELQIAKILGETRVDVIYTDWQKLGWTGGEWRQFDLRTPIIQSDALADILSDRNFLQLSSCLFKAETINSVDGFDQLHEPIEDVGLCVKIAIAGGTFAKASSDRPMSCYRDLPRSFSKIDHKRFIESCIRNAKLAERYVRSNRNDVSCLSRTVDAIVAVYYAGARYFAGLDWNRFEEIVLDIESLRPTFVPNAPASINVLSRMVGYRKAERLAVLYRKGRKSVERLSRGWNAETRDWRRD